MPDTYNSVMLDNTGIIKENYLDSKAVMTHLSRDKFVQAQEGTGCMKVDLFLYLLTGRSILATCVHRHATCLEQS